MAATWLVLAWGVLAFGAVYPWGYIPLLIGCAGVGLAGLILGGQFDRSQLLVVVALGVLVTACALQLVPVSRSMLVRLSPFANQFLSQYELGYARGAPYHAVSIAPERTVLGLECAAAFAIFLVGATRLLSPRDARALAGLVCVLGSVVALIGIIQQPLYHGRIYGFWKPHNDATNPFGPFVNRHHFAGWMLMALPVSWGFVAESAERGLAHAKHGFREKFAWLASDTGARLILAAFGVALMALSLVMTLSRSGIVAFLVWLGAGTWLAARRRAEPRGRLLVLMWLGLLGVISVAATGVDAVLTRFAEQGVSLTERVAIWRNTIDVARRFPLTGTGLNTFGSSMLVYQTADPDGHLAEAHNDYLQLAAEGGLLVTVPAAALLVVIAAIVSRRLASSRATPSYWVRAGAVTGLIAIGVQELADFSLQMPGNAALFAVLCAIAISPRTGSV